jgi:hypothetical protein
MGCPFCGLVFNAALNAGAGAIAGSVANHIRARHPVEATVVGLVGGAVILWLLYLLFKL